MYNSELIKKIKEIDSPFFVSYVTLKHKEETSLPIPKTTYEDDYQVFEDLEEAKDKYKQFLKLDNVLTAGVAVIIESTDHI